MRRGSIGFEFFEVKLERPGFAEIGCLRDLGMEPADVAERRRPGARCAAFPGCRNDGYVQPLPSARIATRRPSSNASTTPLAS